MPKSSKASTKPKNQPEMLKSWKQIAEFMGEPVSVSIPAAAAIQNARLFAKADIYASELEKRLVDLREAENALAQAKGSRQVSEDKFQKVFRCSPIPFRAQNFGLVSKTFN